MLSVVEPDFDLAFALTGAGVSLVLIIEQLALYFASAKRTEKEMEVCSDNEHCCEDSQLLILGEGRKCRASYSEDCVCQKGLGPAHLPKFSEVRTNNGHIVLSIRSKENKVVSDTNASVITQDKSQPHEHEDAEILAELIAATSVRDVIILYIMEAAIALHSLVIGINMGTLGPDDNATLLSLMVVLSFHQFLEGVGLGIVIRSSKNALGNSKITGFIIIFSTMMPIGILIGILISTQKETLFKIIVKGVINSLAAGSLLFISLSQMVGTYFTDPQLQHKPLVKLSMTIAFTIGVFFMALMSYWA